MDRFENLNFYELLEIPVSASSFEIRQAYRNALSIYEEDSMISDAFFTDEERNVILRRIEEAFSMLIDKGQRVAYNRKMVDSGAIDDIVAGVNLERLANHPVQLSRAQLVELLGRIPG